MAELLGKAERDAYAAQYEDIEQSFLEAAGSFGLAFAAEAEGTATPDDVSGRASAPTASAADAARAGNETYRQRVDRLAAQGARVDNDGKSLWTNWKSPACVACMKGVGTETFLTSTKCPRNCYFCFNPNQEDYEFFLTHVNPIAQQLEERHRQNAAFKELAITGGEPLLHLDSVLVFLETAQRLYPQARTRLYTSAFGWTDEVRDALADAGLAEVRFSVKMEDAPEEIEKVLAAIGSAVGHFDAVMVEMPVMPDQREAMESLLVRLDSLGVTGINLLELCFPFHNAQEFAMRGYRLKPSPYRVLYNYWYGGGLPIAGSEETCLDLVQFALERGLALGVHYCSLENKLTGQVYQQNLPARTAFAGYEMDESDFFLKSVKAFGPAVPAVTEALEKAGLSAAAEVNEALGFIQVAPSAWQQVRAGLPTVAAALSYAVVEADADGPYLRELKVEPL